MGHVSPEPVPSGWRAAEPSRAVIPVLHTPYHYDEEISRRMIDTEIVVGSGMKLTVSRDELAQKLGIVSRAVSTRSSVQVLLGVLLRAEASGLHLAATDMELSLRASLDAEVEDEGA